MVIGSRQDAHGGWSECKQRPRNQSIANGSGGGSFWQPAIKTANGCRHIPQAQLNKFLEATKHSQTAARNTDRRRVSGSNQIIGRIIEIKTSGLVAQTCASAASASLRSLPPWKSDYRDD